jgi:hypothetical protein
MTGDKPPLVIMVQVDERGYRIGEGHPSAKFSDAEIELMRQLAEGEEGVLPLTFAEIARKFETSKGAVHDIVNFRRRASTPAGWKEVRRR